MATEGKNNKRMIMLKSSDGEEFEVEEAVAMESQMICHMIEENCANNGISLLNVTSNILAKVIEYCNKHIHASKPTTATDSFAGIASEDLKTWEADFVRVDQATLFDLIMAAHYLNIKGLLNLTCQRVADMIKGKTPEEIRTIFKIKHDFSPDEEDNIRRESPWLYGGKI